MREFGNQWSWWPAYVSFFRHVARLDLPIYDKWRHFEAAAIHAGPRWLNKRFAIVSDRPLELHVDERNRPHKVGGPFCRWADGWELFYVAGVKVDKKLAMGEFTAADVMAQSNAELRRIMVDIYGRDRWLRELAPEVLHADVDAMSRPRRLLRVEMPDDEPMVLVELINSTPEPVEEEGQHAELWRGEYHGDPNRGFKVYRLRVDPELRPLPLAGRPSGKGQALTCQNAVASLHGRRGPDYRPSVET